MSGLNVMLDPWDVLVDRRPDRQRYRRSVRHGDVRRQCRRDPAGERWQLLHQRPRPEHQLPAGFQFHVRQPFRLLDGRHRHFAELDCPRTQLPGPACQPGRHRNRRPTSPPTPAPLGPRKRPTGLPTPPVEISPGRVGIFGSIRPYASASARRIDRANERDETCHLTQEPGFTPVVPPKKNRLTPREYDGAMYKRRNEIQRLFL